MQRHTLAHVAGSATVVLFLFHQSALGQDAPTESSPVKAEASVTARLARLATYDALERNVAKVVLPVDRSSGPSGLFGQHSTIGGTVHLGGSPPSRTTFGAQWPNSQDANWRAKRVLDLQRSRSQESIWRNQTLSQDRLRDAQSLKFERFREYDRAIAAARRTYDSYSRFGIEVLTRGPATPDALRSRALALPLRAFPFSTTTRGLARTTLDQYEPRRVTPNSTLDQHQEIHRELVKSWQR